jgi:hypothetical protein
MEVGQPIGEMHFDRDGRRGHARERAAANDGDADSGLGNVIEGVTMREAASARIQPDG